MTRFLYDKVEHALPHSSLFWWNLIEISRGIIGMNIEQLNLSYGGNFGL